MSSKINETQAAAPAATGSAGPQFEAKVGAFYLLSLIARSEPRGLAGATVKSISFQQRASGHPLDDVVVHAVNADGTAALLEIQAKRTMSFTSSDKEFKDVVAQVWKAAQKPEFENSRYELAAAVARTTTRIEQAYQEVLHWARELRSGAEFAAHIAREKFASKAMRDFVGAFRANLAAIQATTDDETVWRLLRRFQILPFDFESPGSDYEHRARERSRWALAADQSQRAGELWPVLIKYVAESARAAGSVDGGAVVQRVQAEHDFRFEPRADLRKALARLAEAASDALAQINDDVGGVKLARGHLVDRAETALAESRVLHIVGSGGVGKSWVLKTLAQRIAAEGCIIVLRNGRIIAGGWTNMAHAIDCPVSRDELFNELGCGGGAILFIDNIDQIADLAEWATVTDLLLGVVNNNGWRAVVTGGIGNEEWKTNLPRVVRDAGIAPLRVDAISDDEAELLSDGNQALALLLGSGHPAHDVSRNLFYLSRMVEFSAGRSDVVSGVASEIDLASLWWRYGGGRTEDDKRFARLKAFRAMGAQVLSSPGRVAFKVDEFDSATVAELLRLDSLREDIKGATVAFRHDVLRDWTLGFLLAEDENVLRNLPLAKPLPAGLARGVEVAARIALDTDDTGARWSSMLAIAEREEVHGSWVRPILLALPRTEKALALFVKLTPLLLANDGHRLSEIIRLMIAMESEPIAKLVARMNPAIPIPSGAADLIVPRGMGWVWLVTWLVANSESLPTVRIPDVVKVFQAWLMATQQTYPFNRLVVGRLFEWLALIEDNMSYRVVRRLEDAPPNLNIPHLRDVRDEVRMTAFSYAHLNAEAAQKYLSNLDPGEVRHHDSQAILNAPGSLARAAPAALATFVLGTLIETEDPDDPYSRNRDQHGPFNVHNHLYFPASPGQGPFYELLQHAPNEGLRLVRGLVEHATQWRRNLYRRERRPFPRISIPFPDGTRSFEGDWSTYYWSRSPAPSVITTSALMALEAWGHRQIDDGRPFNKVFDDILGPDGSSLAFVAVAADLMLSHWKQARDTAWPIIATPEILEFDAARAVRDIAGVDKIMSYEQESSLWPVKRADLDSKPSRQNQLSHKIGYYVLHGDPVLLTKLRSSLEQAQNEILQRPAGAEDPINGLRATATRAVHMTSADNWPLDKVQLQDGSEVEIHRYKPASDEAERMAVGAARAAAHIWTMNVRHCAQTALLDPTKSTAAIVAECLAWAKKQAEKPVPAANDDADDDDDFSRKWDRRAVAMTAALVARDYEGDDREEAVAWAIPVLREAAREADEYQGNDEIQYNMAAIATLGLVALYRRNRDATTRDQLITLASHQHPAVISSLGCFLPELGQVDARLPRSVVRVIMKSSAHPRRADSERKAKCLQAAYEASISNAIAAEHVWLGGGIEEPAWPQLPSWLSRPRREFRIGSGFEDVDDDEFDENPDYYVDEHLLGGIIGHLIRMTVGELQPWIADLADHLMQWTIEANGPHDSKFRVRDNRPYTWNGAYFDFAGILSVAIPHADAVRLFVEPISRFKDEPFHDATAIYLRGFDRAMQAKDTKKPENAGAVRSLLAGRLRTTRNYERYQHEKTFNAEMHAGDAMTAMFYQPHGISSTGRPSIPNNWTGLDETMPILADLVSGAPSSGYFATLFLNLVEPSPRAVHLPFVVQVMSAWRVAYGVDTNFWSEKEMGSRVCAWLDQTLTTDATAAAILPRVAEDALKALDVLVRSGVAQASAIEELINRMANSGTAAP
jgi:hypothetical protein